jgi:hypothetical protein
MAVYVADDVDHDFPRSLRFVFCIGAQRLGCRIERISVIAQPVDQHLRAIGRYAMLEGKSTGLGGLGLDVGRGVLGFSSAIIGPSMRLQKT